MNVQRLHLNLTIGSCMHTALFSVRSSTLTLTIYFKFEIVRNKKKTIVQYFILVPSASLKLSRFVWRIGI